MVDCIIVYKYSISVLVSTPFELIKCKQQLNAEAFEKMSHTVRRVISVGGYRGLYQGFWVTFNRDVLSYGLYFYNYFKLKDYWEGNKTVTHFKLMMAGGISGILAWGVSYPFDTMKTIIQGRDGEIKQYALLKELVCNSGINSLFKGLSPALVRAFFVNAAVFYLNEILHLYLDKFV
jgi:solute carrier family 25 carnitine/acylcarnitine transporter 20/29